MLKLPVKILLIIGGIILVVLGSNGLYVYHYRFAVLLSGDSNSLSKLFLEIPVPSFLEGLVRWSSSRSGDWIFPAGLVVVGIVALYLQIYIKHYKRSALLTSLKWKTRSVKRNFWD